VARKKQKNMTLLGTAGELLIGIHPLIECLKAKKRKIISLYLAKPEPKGWSRVKPYLPKSLPNIQYVSRDVLTRLAGSSDHMGIVAYVTPYKYATKAFDVIQKPRLLLLDGVQDVRNLGAILRSAYCTGIDGVLLGKKHGSLLTPAVFKASAGLAEHLNIYVVPSIKNAVKELKAMGYTLYMTVADGGVDVTQITFKTPHCLVIGSEEVGIKHTVRNEGIQVTLPQRDTASYNASVAAGIFLFLTVYQKRL